MAYKTRRAAKRPVRKPTARRNMRVSQRDIRMRRAARVRSEFMRQANIRVSQETVDDVLDEVEDEGITIEEAVARRARRIRARRSAMRSLKAARPARRMRRRAQSEEELEDEQEDMEDGDKDEKEARRRAARRRATMRRAKMRRRAEDDEPKADIEPDEDEKDEKDKEARRRAARKRALARMRNRRNAEVSDDLTGPDGDSANFTEPQDGAMPSDDLGTPDEGDGGTDQTPPASVNEAEDKVLAAYRLIDAQIAHGAVAPNISKAALASKYCKKYSLKEMRIATQQLAKVGKAPKNAGKGNVRVQRRSAAINNPAKNDGFDAECVFA